MKIKNILTEGWGDEYGDGDDGDGEYQNEKLVSEREGQIEFIENWIGELFRSCRPIPSDAAFGFALKTFITQNNSFYTLEELKNGDVLHLRQAINNGCSIDIESFYDAVREMGDKIHEFDKFVKFSSNGSIESLTFDKGVSASGSFCIQADRRRESPVKIGRINCPIPDEFVYFKEYSDYDAGHFNFICSFVEAIDVHNFQNGKLGYEDLLSNQIGKIGNINLCSGFFIGLINASKRDRVEILRTLFKTHPHKFTIDVPTFAINMNKISNEYHFLFDMEDDFNAFNEENAGGTPDENAIIDLFGGHVDFITEG